MRGQRDATSAGQVTVGPMGLLDVLETQLGLPPPTATPADALIAYRGCLQAAAPRFYDASFAVDPINVAVTLAAWRAEWYAHGWQGEFAAGVPNRLVDMAAVEKLAAAVPLCTGQRVQRASRALETRRTQIDRIELLDPLAAYPASWQQLLGHFDVEAPAAVVPQGRPGSDLRRVQDALTGTGPPQPLTGDGSFTAWRGHSRDVTAQAVAERCRRYPPGEVLVIAERDGIVLDNAFERSGQSRAGFVHYSRFRAVTQVLKLGLALLWAPVSPHLLLEFLIHPVGPLRRNVREALAAAVAAQPGVGGRAWQAALTRAVEQASQRGGTEAAQLRGQIAAWLEVERWDPARGAPLDVLIERIRLTARYFAARYGALDEGAERTLYGIALAQAEGLTRALGSLREAGHAVLPRIDLERLIDEVAAEVADPANYAQAQHTCAVSDPAAVLTSFAHTFWWDLLPPRGDVGYPWSTAELDALRNAGVALPAVAMRLEQRSRDWLKPILATRDSFTLIVHDSERGYHPLWTQLTHLFDGISELRVDAALLDSTLPDTSGIPTRPIEHRPLPLPRRWWQLPNDVALARRGQESYSSLAKLFDYPHEYVLRYAAQLRTGRVQELVDGTRLYGNLAHRLFERFFSEQPLFSMLDADAVMGWFAATLPQLIEAEAAVLLEPGRGVDRQRVAATLERALAALLDHLRAAGVDSVRPEFHAETTFKSIVLAGEIDLLLTDRSRREIVLDVKWGSESYHAGALRDGRYLQLATYAYLRHARSRTPYQAYFIVESGRVVAPDTSVFPDAFVQQPARKVAELWRRMAASYNWRWRQLERGRIEVNAAVTQPDADSEPPADALEVAPEPDRFDDFVNLTGWADYQ